MRNTENKKNRRKGKQQYPKTAIAISNGLLKIDAFIQRGISNNGGHFTKKPTFGFNPGSLFNNPFAGIIAATLLGRKKKLLPPT